MEDRICFWQGEKGEERKWKRIIYLKNTIKNSELIEMGHQIINLKQRLKEY